MPEIVHSLLNAPEVWVLALLAMSLASTWWLVRRERRRPTAYSRSAEFLAGVAAWRSMSVRAQAAHDEAVLDAAEAAAARAVPPVVRNAESLVLAEYARTITEIPER
ncbi:hypothetical protein ACTWJ9_33385 (plasmid) [Streptomyces sp. GDS52]|uniref:hypothetical protein n=1 Tax=Streptomyces sp. GDS52 TaxID=3406419 RepID=UPI003FD0A49C